MIVIPDWPWKTVLRLAEERGVSVWLVGGAVRDILLRRPVHDWDYAVDGDALGLARAVADELGGAFFPLDVDRATGRALACDPSGERVVLDFAGLRGPNLRTDLLKRDFSINALAADRSGALIDPAGGLLDLQTGHVRIVSDGALDDDPLRMLRAVRVAGQLGFEIEDGTLAVIQRSAEGLKRVSPERLRDELMRLLALPHAGAALQAAHDLGLLSVFLPELSGLISVEQSIPHRLDAWKHTLIVVDAVQRVLDAVNGGEPQAWMDDAPTAAYDTLSGALSPFAGRLQAHLSSAISGGYTIAGVLKLAALLHDVGKPATVERDGEGNYHCYDHGPVGARMASDRLKALCFSGEAVERVAKIVEAHQRPAHLARGETVTTRAIYRYYRVLDCIGLDVILLSLADHLATWGPNLDPGRYRRRLEVAKMLLSSYLDQYQERIAPRALLTGRDLLGGLGIPAGPAIGRILERIREAQAIGQVNTKEEALELAGRISRKLDNQTLLR